MIAVAALCACHADAAPLGLVVPAGWKELPELADAVTKAAKPLASAAWGEPAMGCYAAWLKMKGSGGKAMLAEVEKIVTVRDVVMPEGDGVLSFGFDKQPYKGRVRAQIAGGETAALACFWNDREPLACDAACTQLVGSMR